MPEAAMNEDGDLPARIGDVGMTGRLLPIESVSRISDLAQELSDDELDHAAGGGCYRNGIYIVGERFSCDDYVCRRCGSGKAGCTCWEPICLHCVHHDVRYVDYGDPNRPNGNDDICLLRSNL